MDMTLSNDAAGGLAWIALGTGAIALLGLLCLIVFFAGVQVFGPLNDGCIALAGIMSGVLAWMLFSGQHSQPPLLSQLALMAAVVGAFVVALGSALVIFRVTGFVLAGFYMQFGNALIGLWLVWLSVSAPAGAGWPRGLVVLGFVAGAMMVLGFLTLPAILRGLDSMDASPWYVNVGYLGWLGAFILFPIWCLWLGRVLALLPVPQGV
jgi:hypothetical protein